ncbi:MAG: iron-containing alcohol dehydrogenase [Lachnospiraceae bacterium]|nr:iron-containing alcohol dehydrogenase [Lachnospiraceae bacterium]
MLNFVHDIPTKVYFGKGQISHLAEALMPYGKKVLLAYGGGSIKKMGLYDEVMKILKAEGCQVTELSGIAPNPRIESVREGVALCREKEIDVILAVGGGSVIDCAKAVAAGFYYEGDPWNMIMNWDGDGRALPLVDILTISATGSEYDPMGVISNLEEQEKIGSVFCYPAVSICDPTYTFSVSAYQTAAGAADIMSHIFEGYFSKTEDSDLFEGIAETVLRSVMKNAPIAIREPENYSARANLMANSSIACSGIPEYGKEGTGWPCHAMEHQLSAYYDITHGVGLAILTPRWMRHILAKDPSVTPRFARFARNVMGLSCTEEAALAQAGIDALEAYFVSTGIPMSLGAVGIDRAHFPAMAAKACRGGRLSQGFVPLDEKDVEAIFEACL